MDEKPRIEKRDTNTVRVYMGDKLVGECKSLPYNGTLRGTNSKPKPENAPKFETYMLGVPFEPTLEDIDPKLWKKFVKNGYRVPSGLYMNGWEHNLLLEEEKRIHRKGE